MIKNLLRGLAIIVAVIALAFAAAAILIPAKKTVVQKTEINASREVVWSVLDDKKKYTEWQDQIVNVEVKEGGKAWTEVTKDGSLIEFAEVTRQAPELMSLDYKMGDSFKGSWHGKLIANGKNKTILRTTDKSEVDSVVMKVMMAMFFDIEDFAKEWNQELKKRAESEEKRMRSGKSIN